MQAHGRQGVAMTTWFCVETEAIPVMWGAELSTDHTVGESESVEYVGGGRWWIITGLVVKRTLGNLSRLPW